MTDDSSSDDDFYDNFAKIKAKAAEELRRIEGKRNGKLSKNHESNESGNANQDVELTSPWRSSTSSPILTSENNHLTNNFVDLTDEKLPNLATKGSSSSSPIIILDDNLPSSPESTPIIDLTDKIEQNYPALKRMKIANDSPYSSQKYSANTCSIHIHSNGNVRIFIHDMDDKIQLLINEYAERVATDPERIILISKELKRCNPEDTPRSMGFAENSTIELDAFENLEENVTKTIRIKYQMKDRKATIHKVLPDLTFEQLKQLFCDEHQLNPQKIYFVFDSDRLGNEDTPSSIGLEDMDCIDVYLVE